MSTSPPQGRAPTTRACSCGCRRTPRVLLRTHARCPPCTPRPSFGLRCRGLNAGSWLASLGLCPVGSFSLLETWSPNSQTLGTVLQHQAPWARARCQLDHLKDHSEATHPL